MKTLLIVLQFLLVGISFAQPLQYGFYVKKEGAYPIKKAQVFGERCSGTNFLEQMLKKNFGFHDSLNDFVVSDSEKDFGIPDSVNVFGHKHFPVWFDEGVWFDPILANIGGSPFVNCNNENYLFIVIFRNPYDWLQSFSKKKYYASRKFRKKSTSFQAFIQKPWDVVDKVRWIERNPVDGSKFKNVIQLRTARIKNMLKIADHVDNIYYLNYETLRDYPIEVMKEISTIFKLPCSHFNKVNTHVEPSGNNKPFIKKEYPPISKDALIFINSQLDKKLESSIGYDLLEPESPVLGL